LFDEMAKIMAEVHSDPEIKRPIVTDESRDYIFSEIRKIEEREARANLSDKDKRLLEYGRRYERQLHRRKYWILAAVFVLVLAMGMTSVGGPQRFFDRFVRNLSGREQEMVDSTGDNIIPPENLDEEAAFEAIEEKFGFYPVRLDYLPDDVVFEGFEINEEVQEAQLLYAKRDKLIVELFVRTNYSDGSLGVDVEDEEIREYEKSNGITTFKVTEYSVEANNETKWKVSFAQNNIYYLLLVHDLDLVQLEAILDNIVIR
jgi:hypothetical protein